MLQFVLYANLCLHFLNFSCVCYLSTPELPPLSCKRLVADLSKVHHMRAPARARSESACMYCVINNANIYHLFCRYSDLPLSPHEHHKP